MNKERLFNVMSKILFTLCLLLTVCVISSSEAKAETEGFWEYDFLNDGTVVIYKYSGAETNVTVPSKLGGKTVTQLGGGWWEHVFEGNAYIENVTIPSSVKIIDEHQFDSCANLKTVSGCAGVTYVGNWAFSNCPNLKKVDLGKKVEIIDQGAFNICTSLESVSFGTNVKYIHSRAFDGCTSLKSITLSEGLKEIGDSAFKNCDSLTNVVIPSNVDLYMDAFGYCDNLYSVKLGVNVNLKEQGVFYECPKLYSVEFKEGTPVIPEYTFKNCSSLKNVKFSSSTHTIGYESFMDCTSLEKIDILSNVRYIYGRAFQGCTNVKSVILRYGLLEIHDSAFENLPLITSVTIPNSVYYIDSEIFYLCTNLLSVTVPSSVTKISDGDARALFNGAQIKCELNSAIYNYAVENSLATEISGTAKPATSISFSKKTVTIAGGETYSLAPTVKPSDTTDSVIWASSDENIAVVDGFGKVTGKNTGLCTIVATTASGKRAAYNVNVTLGVEEIYFNAEKKVGVIGKTFTFTPIVKDRNGVRTDIKITYKSSDSSIATVSSKGVVTPKKAGVITISADAGDKRATYVLTVYSKMSLTSGNISKKLNTTSYTYNGKAKKPTATITLNGKKLVSGTDYTITYKNNTYVGTATATIKGKGRFTGSVSFTFKIKKPSIKPKQNTSAYATNAATLKWGKVYGVTGYEIYRSTSKTGTYKKVGTTTKLSYKNTGLSAGKTYYYKVKAYKTVSGKKKEIVTSSVIKAITSPAKPTIKVTAGTKKAKVTWKSVTSANGYEVYMATSKNGTYKKVKTVYSSTSGTKSFTKTGLTKKKTYYFKVKAYRKVGSTKVYSAMSSAVRTVVK